MNTTQELNELSDLYTERDELLAELDEALEPFRAAQDDLDQQKMDATGPLVERLRALKTRVEDKEGTLKTYLRTCAGEEKKVYTAGRARVSVGKQSTVTVVDVTAAGERVASLQLLNELFADMDHTLPLNQLVAVWLTEQVAYGQLDKAMAEMLTEKPSATPRVTFKPLKEAP